MRRYGEQTPGVTVPGRDAGLKLTLQPTAEPAAAPEPCEPAITGLYWFSDSTGLFDQDVEAAYLLAEGAAGPVLGVAGLVGESCDLPVVWTKVWTPASGEDGDPGYLEDGARLVVYPLADTVPGVLEVSAEHDGQSYGPILLTVVRYACAYYGSGSGSGECITWVTGLEWTGNASGHTGTQYVAPDEVVAATAQLIGDLGNAVVNWKVETGYGMRVSDVSSSPLSGNFSANLSRDGASSYGYMSLTAEIYCGGYEIAQYTIAYYLWPPQN